MDKEKEETTRSVTWSRSRLIAVQWNNVVLWGDPLKVCSWVGWVVAAHRRKCVSVCYEANVPNGKFKKAGGHWNILAIASIVSLPFPISVKITSHPPPTPWPSRCLWPEYSYSVSAGDRVQAFFRRRTASLEDNTLDEGATPLAARRRKEECVCVYACVRVW